MTNTTTPDAQADWPTIVDRFRSRFSDVAHRGATNHGTKGANFMTPDLLGFIRVNGEIIEITTGTGFQGERIFGVTWPRIQDGSFGGQPDERDQCAFSLDEVAEIVGLG